MSCSRDLKNRQRNDPGFHRNPKVYTTSCYSFDKLEGDEWLLLIILYLACVLVFRILYYKNFLLLILGMDFVCFYRDRLHIYSAATLHILSG